MDKTKEYTNGELTIVWNASKCFHSGKCVQGCPEVFKPNDKPWIQMENASTDDMIKTVSNCPSGALTYYLNEEGPKSPESSVKVELVNNGPLLLHGTCEVQLKDGTIETKDSVTAFCRCGASENKPYCDGAHRRIEFKG